MTEKEAERVSFIFESIKICRRTPDRIMKLHKEGRHDEVTRLALEITSELQRKYQDELTTFKTEP